MSTSITANQTSERISICTTSSRKAMIQRAASLRGQTLTEFVLAAALESAKRTISAAAERQFSAVSSVAFAEALLRPLPAYHRLERAAKAYAERYDAV